MKKKCNIAAQKYKFILILKLEGWEKNLNLLVTNPTLNQGTPTQVTATTSP